MSPSILWFDVGWRIKAPHNKQRGLEQRDWNRGREGRKGRAIDRWTLLWLKMAAVSTADCEGLCPIRRRALGAVCDSAQQNQEAHSEVNQQVCLLWKSPRARKTTVTGNFPLCCLPLYYGSNRLSCQWRTGFVVSSLSSKPKHIIWFDQWMFIPWPDSRRPPG